MGMLFALLLFALWIFSLFDVVTSAESRVRVLPKLLWLIIVLLLPALGSVVWLWAGRPRRARPAGPAFVYEKLDTTVPVDDDEFRRRARARVQEQRRRYREGQHPER